MLDCRASDKDDPTEDPRFGRMGKQVCQDTGPLTRKRMETADEEFLDRTMQFIRKNHKAGKPWMVMEKLGGGSLGEVLLRDGALTPERALRYAEAIADAVASAKGTKQ